MFRTWPTRTECRCATNTAKLHLHFCKMLLIRLTPVLHLDDGTSESQFKFKVHRVAAGTTPGGKIIDSKWNFFFFFFGLENSNRSFGETRNKNENGLEPKPHCINFWRNISELTDLLKLGCLVFFK